MTITRHRLLAVVICAGFSVAACGSNGSDSTAEAMGNADNPATSTGDPALTGSGDAVPMPDDPLLMQLMQQDENTEPAAIDDATLVRPENDDA